jgi:sulfur carrier protein
MKNTGAGCKSATKRRNMSDKIDIIANGKDYTLGVGASLGDFMKENGIAAGKTVVAVNGEIVKRNEVDSHVLNTGDTLDLMTFVGGG